jgi:hypothetical protein
MSESAGMRTDPEFAFNRAFHRALGAPPEAYRREHAR